MSDPSRTRLPLPSVDRVGAAHALRRAAVSAAVALLVGAGLVALGVQVAVATTPALLVAAALARAGSGVAWGIAGVGVAAGAALGLPVEATAVAAAGFLGSDRPLLGLLLGLLLGVGVGLVGGPGPGVAGAALVLVGLAAVPGLVDAIRLGPAPRLPTPAEVEARLGAAWGGPALAAWASLQALPPSARGPLVPLAARVYRLGAEGDAIDAAALALGDRPELRARREVVAEAQRMTLARLRSACARYLGAAPG